MTIGSAHLTCACIAGTASEEKLHPFECIRRHSTAARRKLPGAAEKVRALAHRWLVGYQKCVVGGSTRASASSPLCASKEGTGPRL